MGPTFTSLAMDSVWSEHSLAISIRSTLNPIMLSVCLQNGNIGNIEWPLQGKIILNGMGNILTTIYLSGLIQTS